MDRRILIVDDEDAFGEIGELILSRAGFVVVRARNADEALKALPDVRPDLILSDVEMPGMDGFDLLRTIRNDPAYKDLPFALMSARRTYPPDRVKGLALGSDDYIAKPFSGDELVARVKAILRRSGKPVDDAPAGVVASPPVVKSDVLTKYLEDLPSRPGPSTAPSAPPTSQAVLSELKRRLDAGEPAAIVLANLTFFRGYNECLGFEKGDAVLKFLGDCFDSANKAVSDGKDRVAHLFADEFLLLTTPDHALPLAQAALQAFAHGILAHYPEKALSLGFIETKNRQGRMVAYPFLNLLMGVASNAERKLTHPGQFIHIGRELLTYAKTLGGSRYVIDRRKDPAPGTPS